MEGLKDLKSHPTFEDVSKMEVVDKKVEVPVQKDVLDKGHDSAASRGVVHGKCVGCGWPASRYGYGPGAVRCRRCQQINDDLDMFNGL